MSTELTIAERAQRIAELVPQLAQERADLEHPTDWTRWESFSDFLTTVRSVEAWTEGPRHARVVVARPRMHPCGGYWSNVASALLDSACDRVDTAAGISPNAELNWRIDPGRCEHEARLVPLIEQEPYECGDCGAAPGEKCKDTLPQCPGSRA